MLFCFTSIPTFNLLITILDTHNHSPHQQTENQYQSTLFFHFTSTPILDDTPPTDRAPRQKHFLTSLQCSFQHTCTNIRHTPPLIRQNTKVEALYFQYHLSAYSHQNRHTSPLTNRTPRQKHFIFSFHININFQHTYTYIGHTSPHTLPTDTQLTHTPCTLTHPYCHSHTPTFLKQNSHLESHSNTFLKQEYCT